MSQYSKEQVAEIHKLATDFTKATLREYPQDNMCFTVSYPLSLYLENMGYENQIVCGNYQNENSPKKGTPHFWLQLNDSLKTIVDPTIGQFENYQFLVYVGKKPKEFAEIPYKFDEWFCGVYQKWKEKLFGYKNPIPHPEQFNNNSLDPVMLLNVNLNAATMLYSQTKGNNKGSSYVYEKYFDCIFQIIRNYYGKKEWSQIIFIDGFNNLFSKALAG